MRNKKFFAVTGAALLLLAGCRTIPQNPEQMTCSDLQYLAEESIDKLGLSFFATQVKYPGDWRPFARNQWIKEGSRVRVRDNKRDYLQMEILEIGGTTMEQTPYRVRIPVAQCKNANKERMATLEYKNLIIDSPEKISRTEAVDFKGKESVDYLARLICGFQPIPALDKTQIMAQKWKNCTPDSAS